MLSEVELTIQRNATKSFISADPSIITLLTRVETWNAGTLNVENGVPRNPQVFKLIWEDTTGIVSGPPNGARRFDFVLVGPHDAEIAIGDYWKTGTQEHRIEWIAPSNGYEVKAGGYSHGPKPSGN